VGFSAQVTPYLAVELAVGLGVFGQDLVDVKILTGQLGIIAEIRLPLEALLNRPLPNAEYQNPTWAISGGVNLALTLGLDWGSMVKLLTKKALPGPSFDVNLFTSQSKLGESRTFGLTAAAVSPGGLLGILVHRQGDAGIGRDYRAGLLGIGRERTEN
jgi:hypothetical protein